MTPTEPDDVLVGLVVRAAVSCGKSLPSSVLLNGNGSWHAPVDVDVIVVPTVLHPVTVEKQLVLQV